MTTTGTAVSQASGTASEQNSSTYNFWCRKSKKKRKTLSSYKANIGQVSLCCIYFSISNALIKYGDFFFCYQEQRLLSFAKSRVS